MGKSNKGPATLRLHFLGEARTFKRGLGTSYHWGPVRVVCTLDRRRRGAEQPLILKPRWTAAPSNKGIALWDISHGVTSGSTAQAALTALETRLLKRFKKIGALLGYDVED